MKLFIVHVRQRRVRAIEVAKFAVAAESRAAAIDAVRNYYPANVRGWGSGSEFAVMNEVSEGQAVPV